jgi:hypothetical protein
MQAEAILIKQTDSWALITQENEVSISATYGDYATLADRAFDMLDRKDIFGFEIHTEDGTVSKYPL